MTKDFDSGRVTPKRARFGVSDVVAGVSVAAVLIPQAMAYAALAGLPAVHGLYAATVPLIAAAFFASSPNLQTGPGAMTAILAFGVLSTLASPLTSEYVAMAALLAIVVGVSRVAIGMVRGGFVVYLMSQPVLTGFTSAAAILIVMSQVPNAVGAHAPTQGIVTSAVWALGHPSAWSTSAIVITIVTVLLIEGGRRVHTLFPGVLVAVVVGSLYGSLGGYTGPVLGSIPTGIPAVSIDLPWARLPELIVPGLVIALVGFAEPAAIARSIATKTRQPWSANREFVSQGAANIAAGLVGGFPVGGSFARTMLNRAAGGRTRWSGAVTGVAVLAFLPLSSILSGLPRAILAAVVIASVVHLVDFRALITIIRSSRAQAVVGISTFVLTLVLAPRIDLAVMVGIGLGVAVHLWRERRVDVRRSYEAGILRLEPVGVLYFGSAPQLDDALIAELADHPDASRLVLDLRGAGRIDYTGALVIRRVAQDAEEAGLDVEIIAGRPPQGHRLLERVLGSDSPWLRSAR